MVSKVLNRPTLVLNRNWQAVNVATVARALVLLWNESARVVDPSDYQTYTWEDWSKLRPAEGDRFIQAVRFRLRVPEVITLTDYDRLPAAAVSFSRRNIFKRDHFTCQYCGKQPGMAELTLDHVIPRAQSGESRWDNCVLACLECNKRKADRTPEQAKMRLKRKPVQPTWNPLYAAHDLRIELVEVRQRGVLERQAGSVATTWLPAIGPGALMPTWLDIERRPPRKRNHAGANPVVGSDVPVV